MSQLKNLLTNKVVAFKLGGSRNLSRYRKVKRAASKSRRIRPEITEQRALAPSQSQSKPQPKPGILRRAMSFIRRAAKVA